MRLPTPQRRAQHHVAPPLFARFGRTPDPVAQRGPASKPPVVLLVPLRPSEGGRARPTPNTQPATPPPTSWAHQWCHLRKPTLPPAPPKCQVPDRISLCAQKTIFTTPLPLQTTPSPLSGAARRLRGDGVIQVDHLIRGRLGHAGSSTATSCISPPAMPPPNHRSRATTEAIEVAFTAATPRNDPGSSMA